MGGKRRRPRSVSDSDDTDDDEAGNASLKSKKCHKDDTKKKKNLESSKRDVTKKQKRKASPPQKGKASPPQKGKSLPPDDGDEKEHDEQKKKTKSKGSKKRATIFLSSSDDDENDKESDDENEKESDDENEKEHDDENEKEHDDENEKEHEKKSDGENEEEEEGRVDVVVVKGGGNGRGKWDDAFSGLGKVEGPSTFEAAMMWVAKETSRNEMHQLIGALNFPTTPFYGNSLSNMHKWWTDNRAAMLSNKKEFIDCVRQTYTRRRMDSLKTARAKEAEKNDWQRQRDEYAEKFTKDQKIMSNCDFLFAVIYPVDHYSYEHGWIRGANSLRKPPSEDTKSLANQTNIANQTMKLKQTINSKTVGESPLASKCPPILCRVQITTCPQKEHGYIPSKRIWRFHPPKAEVFLTKDATVRYLRPSEEAPLDHYIGISDGQRIAQEQSSDPMRLTVAQIKANVPITINGPDVSFHRKDVNFEWTAWLRKLPLNQHDKKEPNDKNEPKKKEPMDKKEEKVSLDAEASDPGASDDDEVAEIVFDSTKHPYVAREGSSIGIIKLLPLETHRYTKLAKQFHKFQHVTTIPEIWHEILELQLSP